MPCAPLSIRKTLGKYSLRTGDPFVELLLAGTQAGPPGRLYLPPDTMHASRIQAGELLLVGAACGGGEGAPAPAPASPFAPASPQLRTLSGEPPVCCWHRIELPREIETSVQVRLSPVTELSAAPLNWRLAMDWS